MPRTQPPSPLAALRFPICASSFRSVAPDARRSRSSRLVSSTFAFVASAAAAGTISRSLSPASTRSSMTGRRIVILLEHEPVMTWLEQP